MSGPTGTFNESSTRPVQINTARLEGTLQKLDDHVPFKELRQRNTDDRIRRMDAEMGYGPNGETVQRVQPAAQPPSQSQTNISFTGGGTRDANVQSKVSENNAKLCKTMLAQGNPAAERVCASGRRPGGPS